MHLERCTSAATQDTFEMILASSQAADMEAIILDHIEAIMASRKAPAAKDEEAEVGMGPNT